MTGMHPAEIVAELGDVRLAQAIMALRWAETKMGMNPDFTQVRVTAADGSTRHVTRHGSSAAFMRELKRAHGERVASPTLPLVATPKPKPADRYAGRDRQPAQKRKMLEEAQAAAIEHPEFRVALTGGGR